MLGLRYFTNLIKTSFNRSFNGARTDGYNSDWIVSPIRDNEQLKKDLKMLIVRSRDLSKNNSDYIKYLLMREVNIIGATGIKLRMNVTKNNGNSDYKKSELIELHWIKWGKKRNKYCSHDGLLSWLELQVLADRTLAVDGDSFFLIHEGANNPYLFKLQPIDSLDVDIELNVSANYNQNQIIMGIEFDSNDKVVAYHLKKNNENNRLGDYNFVTTHNRIPAERMIHIYQKRFAGQVRGFPLASGAILDINMADGYKKVALVGARAAACQLGVWEDSGSGASSSKLGNLKNNKNFSQPTVREMVPGQIIDAPAGKTFKAHNPTQPVANFPHFMKAIQRSIANGVGMLYNALFNDYEGVNFSSLRAGAISERDNWMMCQQFLIENFHEIVFAKWLKYFLLSGQTNLQLRNYERLLADNWQPRRWVWVDPVKDANANRLKLEMNLTSRQRLCSELGVDFFEVADELARENLYLQNKGLTPDAIDEKTVSIIEELIKDEQKEEEK
ncbi:phage portal protein [Lentisphaerota bacterium WC36G]|nr:phage portal protein [Lentisphaerae bacterium WC36]